MLGIKGRELGESGGETAARSGGEMGMKSGERERFVLSHSYYLGLVYISLLYYKLQSAVYGLNPIRHSF